MGTERTVARFVGAWIGLTVAVYPIVGVTPLDAISSIPVSTLEPVARVLPVSVVLVGLLFALPLVVALPVAVAYARHGYSVTRLVAFVVVAFLAVQLVVFLGGGLLALIVSPRRAEWYSQMHLHVRVILFVFSYLGAYLVVFRLDVLPIESVS